MPKKPDRMAKDAPDARYRVGLRAEEEALALLVSFGHRFLAQRARTPHGEIDLITEDGATIVFTEVKYRKTQAAAAEAVSARQRARILNAAQVWLAEARYPAHQSMRFDVVLLAPGRAPRHIANAFGAEF